MRGGELGRVDGEETVVMMHCMREDSIFNKEENKENLCTMPSFLKVSCSYLDSHIV